MESQSLSDVGEFVASMGADGKHSDLPGIADIWIPEKRIGIRVVPTDWWKSGRLNAKEIQAPIVECATRGVKLLHVADPLWQQKNSIMKSKLRVALGTAVRVPARKTDIVELERAVADAFLQQTHVLGPNTRVNEVRCVGLSRDEELLMVAVWGRRQLAGCEWELLRLASKPDHVVVGGLSRCIKWFTSKVSPTFATLTDISWGTRASSWEQFGFKFLYTSRPVVTFLRDGVMTVTDPEVLSKHKYLSSFDAMVAERYLPILNHGYHVLVFPS